MYAGVTGMKNHQTRMDTLSNNIANVNTNGYKSARTNFQDTLYQTIRSEGQGGADATSRGSRNASQVGLGMQVGSISVNFTQGPMLYTGRTLDLGIDGEGFFIVGEGDNEFYTRDGVFYIDQNGFLVTGDGLKVQYVVLDEKADPVIENKKPKMRPIQIALTAKDAEDNEIKLAVAELSIEPDGSIKGKATNGEPLKFVDNSVANPGDDDRLKNIKIALATFPNKEGLKRMGKNLYAETTVSGEPSYGNANNGAYGAINSGYLEGSNVELTEEFTNMITTQRGYQASARVITTSDTMLEELINLKR